MQQIKEIQCALVDDCPLIYDCALDDNANPAECPMVRMNITGLISPAIRRLEELQGK